MPRTVLAAALALIAAGLLAPQLPGRPDDPKAAPKDAAPKDAAPKDKDKAAPKPAATGFARFQPQEIDKRLNVGYAVVVADVNGDGKPDIVVVDTDKVVWYENPGSAGPEWKRRTMIQNVTRTETEGRAVAEQVTKPDNVCIAATDLDGD